MIGVGLVTCNRPLFYEQSSTAIEQHLSGEVDLILSNDDIDRRGVAVSKNHLLREMLDAGCDWLFLCEDDIIVTSPQAVHGYIAACEFSGYGHLMFHGHGPHNPQPLQVEGLVTLWPNYVGAWTVYHRDVLLECGLLDEQFHNAWEHVEHTLRLSLRGFTPPWRGAADATGSEHWLREIPGSIERSTIRQDPAWLDYVMNGKRYWSEAHPDTYDLVFGGDSA